MYKLKANVPDFQVCAGPFEGRKYLIGQTYAEIPPEEAGKFEEINQVEPDPPRRGRNPSNTNNPNNPSNPDKEV